MSATIRVGEREATVTDWVWTSEDPQLAEILNNLVDPLGSSPADPDPDRTLAEQMAEFLHGEVVKYDDPEPLEGPRRGPRARLY